jgi:hypothetical protein
MGGGGGNLWEQMLGRLSSQFPQIVNPNKKIFFKSSLILKK